MRAPQDEKIERENKSTLVYPMVVLAGYSNMPTDFQTGLADFHDFLGRVTVAGRAGLTLEATPPESTPPAPAVASPQALTPPAESR
jgi:hypothetical protein